MSTLTKVMVSALVAGLSVLAVIIALPDAKTEVLGAIGPDYYNYSVATSTSFTVGETRARLIKTGSGVLGSVVIASSSATTFTIQDNASTTATSSAKRVVSLPANAAVGTYTFDVAVTEGMTVDVPTGFNGFYTIIWK